MIYNFLIWLHQRFIVMVTNWQTFALPLTNSEPMNWKASQKSYKNGTLETAIIDTAGLQITKPLLYERKKQENIANLLA